VSLRARLALVMVTVIAGPLLAAWWAVGVAAPRADDRARAAGLSRAAAAVAVALDQQCRVLAETGRSVAARLSGPALLGSPAAPTVDAALAGRAITAATARHPGMEAALVPATPGGEPADGGCRLADREDVDLAEPPGTPRTPIALAASLAVVDAAGRPVAAVLVRQRVDGAALAALRDRLGLQAELAVVRPRPVQPASPEPPIQVAAVSAPSPVPAGVLAAAPQRPRGEVDGVPYRLDAPDGLPVELLSYAPRRAGHPSILAAVAVLGCLAALAVALSVLAGRLTRPLAALTATARALGDGDLTVRTGVRGADEIGELAASMDAMADRLQHAMGELDARRAVLAGTFEQFGEALAHTHNLDALLRTVLEAARQGADAAAGTVFLGDRQGLLERVSAAPDGASPAWVIGVLERLSSMAVRAATAGRSCTADLGPFAGSAMATPLLRGGQTVGVIALARRTGEPVLDGEAIAAVEALAAHAGTAVANVREHLDAQRMSVTDALTGAGNMRHLAASLGREVERAQRFERTLSVLMLDLDHFKRVNDTCGHDFGDAVLREFAARLRGCLREVDLVARRGGEEFAVVLPETGPAGAEAVVRRVMDRVRGELFEHDGMKRAVTVSIGIAAYPDHGRTAADVLHAADTALYAAKREGRDRWRLAEPAAGSGPGSRRGPVLPR
jgi:two-component system cell cycle response regulator